SAIELGFDGSTVAKTCDPTESAGVAMKPHGCATSKSTGKIFCNVAGPGLLAIVDVDASPPAAKTVPLSGKGGGYVKAGMGGDYVYTIQASPKEGKGGTSCQVGQLVTIDAKS